MQYKVSFATELLSFMLTTAIEFAAIAILDHQNAWVIKAFTFDGNQMVSYPLGIYNRALRAVFLFVVSLAFMNYPTVLVLLERTGPYKLPPGIDWAAPLVADLLRSCSAASGSRAC